MADLGGDDQAAVSEPLDLVRLSLDEVVFVKLRGDRELKGRLHVCSVFFQFLCNGKARFSIWILWDVEETVYVVEDDDDDEDEEVKTIKKQSEMLFVRGDSVVLISPQAPS
ncbi:hypothetical protein Q9189_005162 [Teloschistes chrysophthalmus]